MNWRFRCGEEVLNREEKSDIIETPSGFFGREKNPRGKGKLSRGDTWITSRVRGEINGKSLIGTGQAKEEKAHFKRRKKEIRKVRGCNSLKPKRANLRGDRGKKNQKYHQHGDRKLIQTPEESRQNHWGKKNTG